MANLLDIAKGLFPDTDEETLNQGVNQLRSSIPDASEEDLGERIKGLKTAQDQGKFYEALATDKVKNQYGIGNRQKLVDQQKSPGINWDAAGSSLIAGISGTDPNQAIAAAKQRQAQAQQNELNQFDRNRALAEEDKKIAGDESRFARESDPASVESKLAQDLAKSMGLSPELLGGLTAAKFKEFSPVLSKKYEVEQKRLQRQDDLASKREMFGLQKAAQADAKSEKLAEKMQSLQTPYGLANSSDDAKQLKAAHESKKNFDEKINEMIALRKEFGAEKWNEDAVARGEALSRDLLLEYKNMAKLGVLSQSDENIINAIIPKNPLEFRKAQLKGQDPILTTMEKFKKDSDKDFATRVSTRTRQGLEDYASGKTPNLLSPQDKIKIKSAAPMSEKDKQALEWAKSNPSDERSKKILERLGGV